VAIKLLRGVRKRTGDATLEAARMRRSNSLIHMNLLQYDDARTPRAAASASARNLAVLTETARHRRILRAKFAHTARLRAFWRGQLSSRRVNI
jgi:hypothetical protein